MGSLRVYYCDFMRPQAPPPEVPTIPEHNNDLELEGLAEWLVKATPRSRVDSLPVLVVRRSVARAMDDTWVQAAQAVLGRLLADKSAVVSKQLLQEEKRIKELTQGLTKAEGAAKVTGGRIVELESHVSRLQAEVAEVGRSLAAKAEALRGSEAELAQLVASSTQERASMMAEITAAHGELSHASAYFQHDAAEAFKRWKVWMGSSAPELGVAFVEWCTEGRALLQHKVEAARNGMARPSKDDVKDWTSAALDAVKQKTTFEVALISLRLACSVMASSVQASDEAAKDVRMEMWSATPEVLAVTSADAAATVTKVFETFRENSRAALLDSVRGTVFGFAEVAEDTLVVVVVDGSLPAQPWGDWFAAVASKVRGASKMLLTWDQVVLPSRTLELDVCRALHPIMNFSSEWVTEASLSHQSDSSFGTDADRAAATQHHVVDLLNRIHGPISDGVRSIVIAFTLLTGAVEMDIMKLQPKQQFTACAKVRGDECGVLA